MSLEIEAPRLLVAATASGSGKTTIACGLMRALSRRGLKVQACKCGPDYIDPMFHTRVLGTPSRNLDLFFAGEALVRALLADGARDADITVAEGVMGYYDGIQASTDSSAWALAHAANMPTLLVVNARGRALSAAAEVAGFVRFRNPSHIAGIVLNRATASYYPLLKEAIEQETGIAVVGYVPTLDDCSLESRHLGLVTADEVADLQLKVDRVADALEETLDVDAILAIARNAPAISYEEHDPPGAQAGTMQTSPKPTIAVARDAAFSFYYSDTLALLERLGATLVDFSPLCDAALPRQASGLYIGGGYPELHAAQLSGNAAMRASIRNAIASGMPTIAECGGFMYLHETMEDAHGTPWPMVGAVSGHSFKRDRLGRFGYVTLTARTDSLLCAAGECLPAHEFHYWDSSEPGSAFDARKPLSSRSWECAVATESMYAGYPHLYLRAAPDAARRFVEAASSYSRKSAKGF